VAEAEAEVLEAVEQLELEALVVVELVNVSTHLLEVLLQILVVVEVAVVILMAVETKAQVAQVVQAS
jgi:hypothetical protein